MSLPSEGAVAFDASGTLMRVTGRCSGCPGSAAPLQAAGGFCAFVELTTRGVDADALALFRSIAASLREAA